METKGKQITNMCNKWKNRGGSGQQVKKEEKQPLVLSCPKLRSLLISHLEISASASDYQHPDRHWHQHCENFIFDIQFFKIFFEKKTNYFFLCLVILHYHHFAINTYFSTISYSSRAGHCWYRKKGA